MDTPIVFTVSQLIGIFLAACGLITAVGAAGAVVISWINKLKSPNKLQNERLDKHEAWLKRHDEKLNNDNNRLINIEKEMTITLKALLAIAESAPTDIDELLTLPGIGPKTASEYGADLLAIVRQHT